MSQIFQPFLSTKILMLQLCLRPNSPFRVGKILIYSIPYAYHKIDLKKQPLIHSKLSLRKTV